MLILIFAMIPSGLILPQKDLSLSIIHLQSTWQTQGLFLPSLLCGYKIGTISAISYLFIGLFYLPIFHGGGSIGYLLTPEFGYLLGFVPAAWICGVLASKNANPNLISYSIYTIISLLILHIIGISYLIICNILGRLDSNLIDLIFINSLIQLPSQVLLCISTSLISLLLRNILLIK